MNNALRVQEKWRLGKLVTVVLVQSDAEVWYRMRLTRGDREEDLQPLDKLDAAIARKYCRPAAASK